MKVQIAEGMKEDIDSETAMGVKKLILMALVLLLVITKAHVSGEDTGFIFNNGFQSIIMEGSYSITSNGLLQLTDETNRLIGRAFYPKPIVLTNTTSFSTTFVFAIRTVPQTPFGHGMAFVISPTKAFPGGLPVHAQYLGLFNRTTNGDPTNHVIAVELDTIMNPEFDDINYNHVGIDINSMNSTKSAPAGYFDDGFQFHDLDLKSGLPMQVWVDYDGGKKQINVTLASINVNKPKIPLLTLSQDLSQILTNPSYVGFSSSNGQLVASHCVLGWSFQVNGEAQNLKISKLPGLQQLGGKKKSMILTIGLPLFPVSLIFLVTSSIIYYMYRKRKFSEIVEEWEENYGLLRFKYKDLYNATKGFRDTELLGSGGFGKVYKGTMPDSNIEVAVKKVSHGSRQGMKEFVAEIVSIGRLRHRNLVALFGYCRRKCEFLLVYDLMPNESLDKYLYNQPSVKLNWTQRFKIIKGVALGLCYLHEEWEQVVVHRDVKSSNVMLDSEFNGRLGDFGLARLYDHGVDPATTRVAGTLGYLAPENIKTGKATTKSDVFAFGVFMLEVACGRRPTELVSEDMVLVDWVYALWKRDEIVEAKDPHLGTEYEAEEVELVLKLGLLCSNSEAKKRPNMRQVVQHLNMEVPLPDLSTLMSSPYLSHKDFDDIGNFCLTTIPESILSGGR